MMYKLIFNLVHTSSELQDLTNRLIDSNGIYEVEVSTEKRKIVTDSMNHMMNGRN